MHRTICLCNTSRSPTLLQPLPAIACARMSALAKALVALTALAAIAELAAAKNFTIEWGLGVDFGDWSTKNPVSVGDTVEFTYGSTHTVDELSEANYNVCSFSSPVSSNSSGRTAFKFDTAGTRYFACKTGTHCNQGQKVAITVADSAAAPPQGEKSPALPPPPPPPPPTPTPTPTPKGNSAVPTASAADLAVKLVLGLGVGGALLAAF
ncbi:uclacyanin-2-like [Phragmites australis]|uniref:uclacyanin-2-like n=1 Tax=Phragmites australis TaxID=29695 RepID=UPI002D7834C7|nr:uclacyanin-2-like [Phragmites australis]